MSDSFCVMRLVDEFSSNYDRLLYSMILMGGKGECDFAFDDY